MESLPSSSEDAANNTDLLLEAIIAKLMREKDQLENAIQDRDKTIAEQSLKLNNQADE
jgi:hypothetical protein